MRPALDAWHVDHPREAGILDRMEYRFAPHRRNWKLYWDLCRLRDLWMDI